VALPAVSMVAKTTLYMTRFSFCGEGRFHAGTARAFLIESKTRFVTNR
jgi:hypothetical protein